MDLKEIRRLVIIALFSDDELMEKFVLKGGNALDLVYGVGTRTSVDIDVSISDDFSDWEDVQGRISKGLHDRFDSAGYVVFDEKYKRRPVKVREGRDPRWGGYTVEFKIIPRDTYNSLYERLKDDPQVLSRSAIAIGLGQQRVFTIDISKHEFTDSKAEVELDDYTIYVYTLPMQAIEKLRAICQQMDEYPLRGYSTPRARDFYDIYSIMTAGDINITDQRSIELLHNIFAAKDVPPSLLLNIEKTKEFHITDWPAVEQSVSGELKSFDFYFDYVLGLVEKLKTAGVI